MPEAVDPEVVTPEALHEELDDLTMDYLETLDNYVRVALDEERLIKEGLINIAHARMIIKPQELTLEGYPNDLTKEVEAPTKVKDEQSEDVTEIEEKMRRLEMNSSKDLECRRIFGQVIPVSLKKAQGSFHRVLERTVERANVLRRLNYLLKRQCEVQKQLKDLDADKENNCVN